MIWRAIARPLLFSLPAEKVHHWSMSLFHAAMFPPVSWATKKFLALSDPILKTQILGLEFDNPLGLAAGFDKQATWFNSLACLGFSHIEVGTITGQTQPGNDRPRLFRLPADQALVNRMGFNNPGSEAVARNLSRKKINTVLGINIGKTKVISNQNAVDDYLKSFRLLYPYADYFTINVSSPNTPGLRELQGRGPLIELLSQLNQENQSLADNSSDRQRRAILLKIAPDLNDDQLRDIADVALQTGIDGVIATNTTISRDRLASPASIVSQIGAGGLSGKPLTIVSRDVVAKLYQQLQGQIPIVGVGGIMSGPDAWAMICSGASLLQTYTGFIYGGPFFAKKVNRFLAEKLHSEGFRSIEQAVGSKLGTTRQGPTG